MNAGTREWVEKAEGDFATAMRELRARRQPNYDAACFHAQQCAEKYLKAWLVEANIRFTKTHDLERLLDLILPREPLWEPFRTILIDLSNFAVIFRYPGESATRERAKGAVADAKAIRQRIRESLGFRE